jgi:hypothetical protein
MTEGKLAVISAAVGAAGALGGALIAGLISLYQSQRQDRRDAIKLALGGVIFFAWVRDLSMLSSMLRPCL